jgi:UDP-3-O-[3-hydroxymyristoyl] glucosamine N-acyltransferase
MAVIAPSFKPVFALPHSLADLFLDFAAPYGVMHAPDLTAARITHVAPLDVAQQGAFSFLSNQKLRGQLLDSQASVIALTQADYDDLAAQHAVNELTIYVCTPAPYLLYAHIARRLYLNTAVQAGVHATAVIAQTAQVDATAQIDARVVVGERAVVGAGAHLKAGVVLGDDVVVQDGCVLHPNVTVYDGCEIGARCILHAGAVIGADGFGFAPTKAGWLKIAQVGRVLIGNDVEIGANTTIDRGALNDTVIHDGVKLDNQIQIAHNCEIGKHTAIASCVGIAGSTTIGENCMIGGAAMIGGHLNIVANTVVSGATAVPSSIEQAGQYTGILPLMLHRDWERNASLIRHLSDLRKRLRGLEKAGSASDATKIE